MRKVRWPICRRRNERNRGGEASAADVAQPKLVKGHPRHTDLINPRQNVAVVGRIIHRLVQFSTEREFGGTRVPNRRGSRRRRRHEENRLATTAVGTEGTTPRARGTQANQGIQVRPGRRPEALPATRHRLP